MVSRLRIITDEVVPPAQKDSKLPVCAGDSYFTSLQEILSPRGLVERAVREKIWVGKSDLLSDLLKGRESVVECLDRFTTVAAKPVKQQLDDLDSGRAVVHELSIAH